MAKQKHAKGGRPTKVEGPKLSDPETVERLLVEGEVLLDEHGEAKRVWLSQRDVAARFGVSVSTIAAFAKEYRTTERREELRAQLDPLKVSPPPSDVMQTAPPPPSDVLRASCDETSESGTPTENAEQRRRPPGRPRHQDAPVIPFAELDRLLVFRRDHDERGRHLEHGLPDVPRAGSEVRRRPERHRGLREEPQHDVAPQA